MGDSLGLIVAVLCIGLFTFGARFAFIGTAGRLRLPPWVEHALRHVPAAVLVALVVPDLVAHAGQVDLSPMNARLVAGALAALVAWRTRNMFLTIAVGMAALWTLLALGAH